MNVPLHVALWVLSGLFVAAAGITWLRKNKAEAESVDRRVLSSVPYRSPEARAAIANLANTHFVFAGIGVLFMFAAMALTPW